MTAILPLLVRHSGAKNIPAEQVRVERCGPEHQRGPIHVGQAMSSAAISSGGCPGFDAYRPIGCIIHGDTCSVAEPWMTRPGSLAPDCLGPVRRRGYSWRRLEQARRCRQK